MLYNVDSAAKIANLRHIILRHENVKRLQVPVDVVLAMHVLQSQANVNEYAPNDELIQVFHARLRKRHRVLFF